MDDNPLGDEEATPITGCVIVALATILGLAVLYTLVMMLLFGWGDYA